MKEERFAAKDEARAHGRDVVFVEHPTRGAQRSDVRDRQRVVARDGPAVKVGDTIELRGGKGPARVAAVKGVGVFAPTADVMPLLVELEPTDMPQLINADVWLVRQGEAGDR